MKRLLVMSYFYPPLAGGGVHRVLSFTRYLREHGWACTVVCAGEHDYWVRDPSLLARVPEGTEVIRVTGGSALAARGDAPFHVTARTDALAAEAQREWQVALEGYRSIEKAGELPKSYLAQIPILEQKRRR